MQRFYLGKKGKVLIPAISIGGLSDLPPMVERETKDILAPKKSIIASSDHNNAEYFKLIVEAYKEWGKFGSDGDIIAVSSEYIYRDNLKEKCQIDFICRLAYPKPKLAADMVPFIRSADGKWFFVGIIRKDNNGKALIGGFREVHGYHFQTVAETCIKESRQEAGLKIEAAEGCLTFGPLYQKKIMTNVSLGEKGPQNIQALMSHAGDYKTGDSENISGSALVEKRVNQTSAFVIYIELPRKVTKNDLAEWLVPEEKEDAKEVFIMDVTKTDEIPNFIFDHHRTIFVVAKLKLRSYIVDNQKTSH